MNNLKVIGFIAEKSQDKISGIGKCKNCGKLLYGDHGFLLSDNSSICVDTMRCLKNKAEVK